MHLLSFWDNQCMEKCILYGTLNQGCIAQSILPYAGIVSVS